ncbi:hypothetical protein LSTR_LSTR005134 [Laodelphax striatellus]|uniref:HTTM-like domain-containing protein n=1 Tax=Laodelphax striatellus TaxID=195883 RepID=A0A482WQP5_LAOST|nr:hypothetical protein LSTR_LSTR005134 [Laodelphax striatellus]
MDPGNSVVRRRKPQKANIKHKSDDEQDSNSKRTAANLAWDEWIEINCGFHPRDLKSLDKLTALFYRPCDATSLSAVRVLFGIVMLIDTLEERGFTEAERLWGDPKECRFPLFNFLRPLPLKWMYFLYTIMSFGAIGISFGAYYRFSCLLLTLPYWYILLLNKSVWNNHSYLYGLLCFLMTCSSASNVWSFDRLIRKKKYDDTVPLWNYSILRFQLFALYFFAGLKKMNRDWLSGYSMMELSTHWVFSPFTLWMSIENVDHLVVHIIGFLLDLTGGFLIFFDQTRPIAFLFLSLFHLMNSRLFHIGMFPYMCLVTMPLFCRMDWPKQMLKFVNACVHNKEIKTSEVPDKMMKIGLRERFISLTLIFYMCLQCFMPYSHFVTKGYNNWTNGLYGYSWDMMVHTWIRHRIVLKDVDRTSGQEPITKQQNYNNQNILSQAWVKTDRWTTHADMLLQYAHCIERNIVDEHPNMKNISVHVDVWYSLNGRFQQRMFDPRVDLLRADWSPFEKVEFLLPLLSDLTHWRRKIMDIREEIWKWSNRSDALFVADFPGMSMESYMNGELRNVSLTALEGVIVLE